MTLSAAFCFRSSMVAAQPRMCSNSALSPDHNDTSVLSVFVVAWMQQSHSCFVNIQTDVQI